MSVTTDRPAWMDHAECTNVDPALFFPERGEDVSQAKAVCRECPVRTECLEHAMANHETFGVWGGTSERERLRMRRLRRRDAGQPPTGPLKRVAS